MKLVRHRLESSFTPEQALLALRDDVRPFGLVGDWAGGGAIVGSEPVRVLGTGEDPLEVLDDLPVVEGRVADAFGGGWVGWLAYGAAGRVERTVPPPPRPVALPEAAWAFYDHVLRLDPRGRWWFEALWSDARAKALEERQAELARRLSQGAPTPRPFAVGDVALRPSPAGHTAAVEHARRFIAAGDLYQVNLTLRLDAPLDGEAIDLFATGAPGLRPARGAYVGDAAQQVASFSPELFLERHGRTVRSAPIKGTVRRTGNPAERAALTTSAKDAAEHVMIVDLVRNDLGRVCAYGTVKAPETPRAEPHPGVWHLVSDVTGELRDDATDADLVRAAFPPGSVTGAPKVKALEVIATLESTGREVYTGAIGFCSPVAGLELSVAIRTFEAAQSRVWLGAGGGIVHDSDPEAELREALVKAAPLLAATGTGPPSAERRRTGAAAPPPVRAARPGDEQGVLETLLAVDGRPVALDEHLERLDASLRAVFGRTLTAEEVERIATAAGDTDGLHRIRATAKAQGVAVTTAPATTLPQHPVTLVPITLPGGAGRHKWADRELLDRERPPREVLVCDLDGTVLETGRGSLVLAEGGRLVTPPADGRILAGTVRALIGAHEEPITLDRVQRADEVLVTSSIRGVQSAHLDGTLAPAAPGPHAQRLAAQLAAAWDLARRTAPV